MARIGYARLGIIPHNVSRLWSKLLDAGLVLLGVYFFLFILLHTSSHDITASLIGQNSDNQTIASIKKLYHLDKPIAERFLIQLYDLSPIGLATLADEQPQSKSWIYLKTPSLGYSYHTKESVEPILWRGIGTTLLLSLICIVLSTIVGVIIGVVSALNYGKWVDYILVSISTLCVSLPSYIVAILLAIVLGYYWGDWTGLNIRGTIVSYTDLGDSYLNFKNLILPVFALSTRPIAVISQMTRSSLLDVLREDYIRTAVAKGLLYPQAIWKHGLINALNPIITSTSSWLGSLLAGSYFVEIIFDLKGLGALTVEAILRYDIPVVLGAGLWMAFIFILISWISDGVYYLTDPRVR